MQNHDINVRFNSSGISQRWLKIYKRDKNVWSIVMYERLAIMIMLKTIDMYEDCIVHRNTKPK